MIAEELEEANGQEQASPSDDPLARQAFFRENLADIQSSIKQYNNVLCRDACRIQFLPSRPPFALRWPTQSNDARQLCYPAVLIHVAHLRCESTKLSCFGRLALDWPFR